MLVPIRRLLTLLLCALFLLVVYGCGGGQPQAAETTGGDDFQIQSGPPLVQSGKGMEVEGTLGTIDEHEVERMLDEKQRSFIKCYEYALDELDVIEGEMVLAMQINPQGQALDIHLRSSDLGSLETESCILKKVARTAFPGSAAGIAYVDYPLSLEPPYDPPKPEIWDSARVRDVVRANQADVRQCLGGKSGVRVTVYIEIGGRVAASGASADSHELYEAAQCLAKAVRGWTFAAPSSETAKVTIEF